MQAPGDVEHSAHGGSSHSDVNVPHDREEPVDHDHQLQKGLQLLGRIRASLNI